MDNNYHYFTKISLSYIITITIMICVLFYYKHIWLGLLFTFIHVALLVYNIKNTKIQKKQWKSYIENFSYKLEDTTKNILLNFPFPLLMIDLNGTIIWYNRKFSLFNEEQSILNKNINDLIKNFDVNNIVLKGINVLKNISYKDKYYDLYINNINTDDNQQNHVIVIYFYDVSENVYLADEINDNKEAIMLLEVDNLDEVVKSTNEDKKPLLIAEIERTINSYAQRLNGAIKKYSNNKYILSTQNKYINKEMEKKFDILDEIREINVENTLSPTLSIGVGKDAENPLENEKLATAAKELALGRGGDQAVVKSLDKLNFYGGNTKEMEKRTKVRARVIAHALMNLIDESSSVFIMGHAKPDIDCLGAAVGIYSATKKLNKECYIVLEDVNNSIIVMMDRLREEGYKNVFIDSKEAMDLIDEDSLLIVVDVHSKGYVENIDVVKAFKKIVLIDHHRKSSDSIEGALLNYIEPYASSTSELVTEIIQYMFEKPKLKPVEAEALLAGICVDTKNFYFKTGVRTFEAASFLRRLGADTIDIKKIFSDDLETYLNRAEIIKSAVVNNGIATAVCPENIQDTVLAAQAADELLNITGIQASFVFVKIEEDIVISARSLGDINVQVILETLGGGGHMTMAGAKLKDMTIEEAKSLLQDAIDKYLREGEE